MNLERNTLAALTRMFSASVFRELTLKGRSPLFARLLLQSQGRLPLDSRNISTVRDAFEAAFGVLKISGNRDEYVYQSAITQKIVLGRHSLNTASVLYEVRAENCKADVVVLNGTSTAYEIKSERDSLARLSGQLECYRRVFASVNVVTSTSHLRDVLAIAPADVGVHVLSSRYTIQVEREPEVRPERTSPISILATLRSHEAMEVLGALGISMPAVPNTLLRSTLNAIFAQLDPTAVHQQAVIALKRSRSQASLAPYLDQMPSSLKVGALATKVDLPGFGRIRTAIETPLSLALTWS